MDAAEGMDLPVQPHQPGGRRLFLALTPDEGVRRQLGALVHRWSWCPGSTLYEVLDWHVTLHFLGQVPADQISAIATGAAVPFAPFDWVLDQPQVWPRGLVVLCPSETPPALTVLQERLGRMLQELHQNVDPRPYQPHLTLARHAAAAKPPSGQVRIEWPVHGFSLLASTGHTHPRYEVLQRYGPSDRSTRRRPDLPCKT